MKWRKIVVFFCMLAIPMYATATYVMPSDRAAALKTYVRTVAAAKSFNGVMLVAEGDRIVLNEAFGYADLELATPLDVGHIFRLASLTKPVTASAVLIAVDRGSMSLDDSVCKFVAPCPASWNSVTLHHLLSHSSGIADHFGDLKSVPVEKTAIELQRVVANVGFEPLKFVPGSRYEYSNFNYVLLGAALEKATGRYWEQALRELLFHPLGMADTGYDDVFAILPRRVHGYDRTKDGAVRNIEYVDHAAYAAGGLRATAIDLFNWSRAALNGKLWKPSLQQAAFTAYNNEYGYGWAIGTDLFGRTNYNHTGKMGGSSSHIIHYPASGLTIIVLSNIQSENAFLRGCDLAGVAFGLADPGINDQQRLSQSSKQRCGKR